MTEKWKNKLEEHREILLSWYERIGEMGHGEITVKFEESNNRMEIIPVPKIRNIEEHKLITK